MNKDLALFSAQQTRDLDARAVHDFAIPGHQLMQRAAQAAWDCLQAHWPQAHSIGFLVGPGNNGGDALEMARLAHAQGYSAQVFLLTDAAKLSGEAKQAWQGFVADGVPLADVTHFAPQACSVWVDGLFGSGLSRPVAGLAAQWINALNQADVSVLALDVPSGLDADTGQVLGVALCAQISISFIARKQGLYTGEALDYVGQRVFDDLDLPAAVFDGFTPTAQLLPEMAPAARLPQRQLNAHKGQHGHVLLIGGAPGYSGAIRLAAGAALRGGAGLVSVLTHADSRDVVSLALPEAMVHVAGAEGIALDELLDRADVLVIGPGLGQSLWAQTLCQQALDFTGPTVLDADALNWLAQHETRPQQAIITPHPGEAGRLLGCSSAQVQADRYAAVRALAQRYHAIAVLKGAGTLLAGATTDSRVCRHGNPGMAVAGMGDVLAGLCGAIVAQCREQDLLDAACTAVMAHAIAGDLVAREHGQRGLLPSDVIATLPQVLN